MPKLTVLTDRFGYNAPINEYRDVWLYELLESIDLDLEILQDAPDDIITEYLLENKVDIVDYPDLGAIRVSFDREVIGEWAGPDFNLKIDGDSNFYYEVTVEYWSILDNE